MLPTEDNTSIVEFYEKLLLIPIIDSPEPNTEPFDDDADYYYPTITN